MSDLNDDLVRAAFGAFARGDLAALLPLIDAEFEWTFLDPSEVDPQPQVCRGTAELARVLRNGGDQPVRELEELVPFGERVLVATRSGPEAVTADSDRDRPAFHVVTVRDGHIVALRACRSRDEALLFASGA
jgi:ketosteroid isomerase-like protein